MLKELPNQSLAGHITNKSMLDVTRLFKQHSIDGWTCLQVHDEISCYVPEERAETGATLLQESMEDISMRNY